MTMAALQSISVLERIHATDVAGKAKLLRQDFDLDIPDQVDLHQFDATLNNWREQQKLGAIPTVSSKDVDILLLRLGRLEKAAEEVQTVEVPSADTLRAALLELQKSPPQTLEQDDAVLKVDTEYRQYRRAFLGGSLKGWLKELANPSDEQLEAVFKRASSSVGSPLIALGGDTLAILGKTVLGIVITLASLFFFLAEGESMVNAVVRLSPLEEKYLRELLDEFVRVCRAVVTASLLSAVVQGMLAGVGFYVAGLENAVALLMLLTMVLSMVPFTGAASVWVPVCLHLYLVEGRLAAAIMLAVYGAGVISTADNFIKPMVLHGQSNLHPLLALLSVLGGIQALGPIGIVVGPMVVVFLQTTLKILQRELLTMDRLTAAMGVPLGPTPQSAPADKSAPPPATAKKKK